MEVVFFDWFTIIRLLVIVFVTFDLIFFFFFWWDKDGLGFVFFVVGVDFVSLYFIGILFILVRGGLVLGGILGNDFVFFLVLLFFDLGEGRCLDVVVKIYLVIFFYYYK